MEQNRLKSKVVWLAIVAQVISILVMLGVIDMGMGEAVNNIVSAVCELLVLFGVLNNPTQSGEF